MTRTSTLTPNKRGRVSRGRGRVLFRAAPHDEAQASRPLRDVVADLLPEPGRTLGGAPFWGSAQPESLRSQLALPMRKRREVQEVLPGQGTIVATSCADRITHDLLIVSAVTSPRCQTATQLRKFRCSSRQLTHPIPTRRPTLRQDAQEAVAPLRSALQVGTPRTPRFGGQRGR